MEGPTEGYGSLPSDAWAAALLAASPDLVLALDPATTIVWCNESLQTFLGHAPDDVIGRSFAEFVHPEDLVRAVEVISLVGRGAFDTYPMTPALYRVRSADGSWVPVDVNASTLEDGSMLVVMRPGGDLVIVDRLLEAVSGGRPFEEQARIVLQFGLWRHSAEGYAIHYRDDDGEPAVLAIQVPDALLDPDAYDGLPPWEAVVAGGGELVIDPLPESLQQNGLVGCIASAVPDPGHVDDAAILIWTSEKGPTTSGHRYAMANMHRSLALALQQRAQVRRLERAAQVDVLTGLVSRARFLELLDAAASPAAVLYVDLDGFKAVNDARGHQAGDATLVATARCLELVAPSGTLVGRLGGDEFALLCPPGTDLASAEALAGRIVDVFADASEGELADVRASVGVAVGTEGQPAADVLHLADVALLDAKGSGRSRWASA